jgi:hypothetical protein
MNLFPANRRKQSRFEKDREAWWILRGAVGERERVPGQISGINKCRVRLMIPPRD